MITAVAIESRTIPGCLPVGGTMKRTPATVLLLAGLGGCMTTDAQKKRASHMPTKGGEPTERMTTFVQKKGTKGSAKAETAIQQASANAVVDANVMPTAGSGRPVTHDRRGWVGRTAARARWMPWWSSASMGGPRWVAANETAAMRGETPR